VRKVIDQWFSPSLHKNMEIVTYGHYGFPLLMFPTAAADYLEYERFLLIDFMEPYINAGKVKVFSINSINSEAWMNKKVHPKYKGIRQQEYNNYISNEVAPYIWNSCGGRQGIITTGASLGAFHCVNQLLRRPDIFDGCIAMSGGYDIRDYYESYGYHDENIYFNNPVEYLPNLWDNHYLPMLRQKKHIHILTGQGNYENPDSSRQLSSMLWSKGVPNNLDVWGWDMPHDWPTWRSMIKYYLAAKF
jgi:esterase/lipase superfamily enzyme